MTDVRVESDTMGSIEVPADHYWGAQTERSLHHFAISHETMPPAVITAFGVLKLASARVNRAWASWIAEKASPDRARRGARSLTARSRTSFLCESGRPVQVLRPT